MSRPQLTARNSPFTEEQTRQLNQALGNLSRDQLLWLSGFLTGIREMPASAGAQAAPGAASEAAEKPELTILYGTETGNAQSLAEQAAEAARARGFAPTVTDMGTYKKSRLKKEQNLLIVTATHGEGDPPEPAIDFYEYVHSDKAPKLDHARFAVLGLGDTSYEHFCQTGKDFDRRLEELGAQRIHDFVGCDVDYEEPAAGWVEGTLDALRQKVKPQDTPPEAERTAPMALAAGRNGEVKYDKQNPFQAEVIENVRLTGRGSRKETLHVELSLEDSELHYEPGDSLGVIPVNCGEVARALIEQLGFRADESVETYRGERRLEDALLRLYEITILTPPLVQRYAERSGAEELQALARPENRKRLMEYIKGREVIDLVTEYPVAGLTANEFVGMLRKLPPRLYSIASSPRANPEEAHLTVAVIRYHANGRDRKGVASTHFADRMREGDTVGVYVHRNNNFRLPEDPSRPIIMVGPGTGVAPFRAFVEERQAQGAPGGNWLFFGEQHFRTDFLYQTEWQRFLKEGALHRMDVAFSRDQKEKVYVQHQLKEQGREVFAWLEEGAYLYVCGDAERMAPDVHQALLDIVEEQGGHSREQAQDYVKHLQKEKRYQKDVY